MKTIILHVDMDAFFASVEVRDDPSLRGKPVIIGSLPGERGVVATCSYEARKYGVRSAMNIKDAYRLCPHGIYRHPDMEKYKAVSEQLHNLWASTASAVEPIALDEAYLEITEQAQNLEGARHIAHVLKQRTQTELGLTCSIGVAYSKTAAKMASEEKSRMGISKSQRRRILSTSSSIAISKRCTRSAPKRPKGCALSGSGPFAMPKKSARRSFAFWGNTGKASSTSLLVGTIARLCPIGLKTQNRSAEPSPFKRTFLTWGF